MATVEGIVGKLPAFRLQKAELPASEAFPKKRLYPAQSKRSTVVDLSSFLPTSKPRNGSVAIRSKNVFLQPHSCCCVRRGSPAKNTRFEVTDASLPTAGQFHSERPSNKPRTIRVGILTWAQPNFHWSLGGTDRNSPYCVRLSSPLSFCGCPTSNSCLPRHIPRSPANKTESSEKCSMSSTVVCCHIDDVSR